MKVIFKEDFQVFKKGDEIEFTPNTVNYCVGLNGSGKSVVTSSLAEHVFDSFSKKEKEKQRYNWMTRPPEYIMDKFTFEGFESVKKISFYTAKHRQSQFVDLTVTFDCPASIDVLRVSEGMNNQAELVQAYKNKDETDRLFIFDEIDGTLDLRAKLLFFDRVLPALKGTVIVCSHETFLFRDKTVFNFSTNKKTTFIDYFIENQIVG